MKCVACGLPGLELTGQTVLLQPYLSMAGIPPVETAGEWHLSCLAADPVASQWGGAQVYSFTQVRGFDRIADTAQWTVVGNPRTREVLALGRLGAVLPLTGRTITPTPTELRMTEPEYWLTGQPPAIAHIQTQLRQLGTFGVLDVAQQLGIRLSNPDSLAGSVFRLNSELVEDWSTTVIGATVEYAVPLPPELRPYVG